jgi:glycosyltransferase 2 family protein
MPYPSPGGVLAGWRRFPGSQASPRNVLPRSPALARLPIVVALGASLHAVGQRASIATLIAASTLAAVIGGAVPVPGGPGVVEAGLIAALASAGVPEDQARGRRAHPAVAHCLPAPVWGRAVALACMRRREYM